VTTIATSTSGTQHVVRLVHSATGKPITAIRLAPVAWPTGWWARVVDGAAVVAAVLAPETPATAGPTPEPPATEGPASIDVIVTDGILASLLEFPAPEPGQPPHSVRVPLAAAEIDVPISATDLTLTVVVAGDTGPSQGLDVKVRGASGSPTVTLAEGAPGTYSATRKWGANLINADLRIGGNTVRKVSLDYGHTETRIHVVDPT